MTARRAWLDAQYSPSLTASDFIGTVERLRAMTAAARNSASVEHQCAAYGSRAAQILEWFLPKHSAADPRPILAMFHGGMWQEGSIDEAGHAAEALVSAGAIAVSVGYTLAPAATLPQIVAEAESAIVAIAAEAEARGGDPRRIVVAGHSAGAHLAAALLTSLAPRAAALVAGLLLIGGIYDLPPVAESYANDLVKMSARDAAALSPASLPPLRDVPVRIRVGEREPEEFHRNAALLAARWRSALRSLDVETVSQRDHFDLLVELSSLDGVLGRDAIQLLGLRGEDRFAGRPTRSNGMRG